MEVGHLILQMERIRFKPRIETFDDFLERFEKTVSDFCAEYGDIFDEDMKCLLFSLACEPIEEWLAYMSREYSVASIGLVEGAQGVSYEEIAPLAKHWWENERRLPLPERKLPLSAQSKSAPPYKPSGPSIQCEPSRQAKKQVAHAAANAAAEKRGSRAEQQLPFEERQRGEHGVVIRAKGFRIVFVGLRATQPAEDDVSVFFVMMPRYDTRLTTL